MTPASAVAVIVTAIGVDVFLSACGGGSPTGPSAADPDRWTVTITESGLSPAILEVPLCAYGSGFSVGVAPCHFVVEFINRDTEPHDVRSDPHPDHTACPDLNIEAIAPGQSKVTPDLFMCLAGYAWRTYHDETRPDDQRFRGRIELH